MPYFFLIENERTSRFAGTVGYCIQEKTDTMCFMSVTLILFLLVKRAI